MRLFSKILFVVLMFTASLHAQTNTNVGTINESGQTLTIGGSVSMKGTDPFADVSAFGAKAVGTTVFPNTTATCTNGGSAKTISLAAAVFGNGDGVTILECGPTNTMSTPGAPTVTPSLAVTGTVPDAPSFESVASPTGASTYCYKVIAIDKGLGVTPPSTATCISNGLATLGLGAPLTISTLARSGKTVTVTTTGTQTLSAGALVHLYGMSNAQFEGYFNVSTVNNAGHSFTIASTPMDTAFGAAASATGGFVGWGPSNLITWTKVTGAWKYYLCGERPGDVAYHLVGTSMPTGSAYLITSYYDFGATMNGNQAYPPYISSVSSPDAACTGSKTNDALTTYVESGGGTTTIHVHDAAGQNASGKSAVYDAAPNILKAIQSIGYTSPGFVGGAIYFPPVPANGQTYGYPINSYFTVPANIKILQAGPIILNETMELGNNINWDGGWSAGIGGSEFAFSSNALTICLYANPCFYINAALNGLYQNMTVDTTGANGTNIWMLDATYNTTFRNVSNDTNQDAATDYFGKAIVIRAVQSVGATVLIEDSSFGNGPTNAVDSSWSPTIYVPVALNSSQATVTSSSIIKINNSAFQLRGIQWNLAGGAYDFQLDRSHRQGGVNPFLVLGNFSGTPGGTVEVSHLLLDSEVQPLIANLTSNTADPNTVSVILRQSESANTDVGGRPPVISGTQPYVVHYDQFSGTYTQGLGVKVDDQNGVAASNIIDTALTPSSPVCTDSSQNLITSGCAGSSGLSGMTATQVPIAASSSTVTSSKALQGTDTKILSSGTVTGTASALCTDANGGATTTGCTGGSISGMTTGQIPVAAGATSITSSVAESGSGSVCMTTSCVMVTPALGTPSAIVLTNATGAPTWNQNTSGTASNLSGTPALPNGTTATTQAAANNSTRLATTAYVDTGLATKASSSAATTVNGQTCTLSSTCTIPFQTNSGSNTSQAGVNFLTSTANSVGLTVTPVNSATNSMKFEITGSSYTGNAATATDLSSYTGFSVLGSAASTKSWITPTGNGQCLMSAPASFASTTPSFQSCPGGGNVSAAPTPTNGQFGIWTGATTIKGTSSPENIFYADLASGADCGAKINTIDSANSGTPIEIWVNQNCGLTAWTNVSLSANHIVKVIQGGTYATGNFRLNSGSGIIVDAETGGGAGTVTFNYTGASGTVVASANQAVTMNGITLKGFVIDCTNGAGNTVIGLDSSGVSNSTGDGISIYDCKQAHLADGSVGGSTVYDNWDNMSYGASSASSGFNGILLKSSANDQHWKNARFSRMGTQWAIGVAGTATDHVDCNGCTFELPDTMAVDVINGFGINLAWPRFEGVPLGVKLEAVSSNELMNIHPYWASVVTQHTDLSGTNGYSESAAYIGAATNNTVPVFNTVGSGGSDQTTVFQSSSLTDNGSTVSTPEPISTTSTIDGLVNTLVTTGTTGNLSDGFSSTIAYNEEGTAATAVTYTLPVAKAGMRKCVFNAYNGSAADTGQLKIQTSGAGQFIIFTDGTPSATGGFVQSSGAAGDTACVMGVDTTHWLLVVGNGSSWTKH